MAQYKGVEVDTVPTEAMAKEAQRGLDWREEFGRGGTLVGVARANQLKDREELSPETVKRMHSYFSRHEVDKQGQGFSPGEEGYPSAGRIAWALWGGDSGQTWAAARVERMNRIDEQERSMEARPYPNEHAARLKDPAQYEEFRREEDAGGDGVDFIYGIKIEDGETVSEIQSVRFDSEDFTADEAMEWLEDHEMEPIEFEEATEERIAKDEEHQENTVMDTKQDQQPEKLDTAEAILDRKAGNVLHRSNDMMPEVKDERRVAMSISSELAVDRGWGREILDHSADSVDLEFLNSGRAPLLLDHDPEKQIGVVENVYLDGESRKLRAVVRFSKSEKASEVYQDVVDNIRGNVSIGYVINKMVEDPKGTYRAMNWRPLEVSVVSIPADQSVGVGRAAESSLLTQPSIKEKIMENQVEAKVSVDAAIAARNKEVAEMMSLATRHNQRQLADEAIGKNLSIEQFRGMLLEKIGDKPLEQVNVGMTEKEIRQYSLMRAIASAAANGGRVTGYEAEVSQELAKRYGKDARGFYVPTDIFKRDILTSSPANGSNLVATDHLASEFVDALRANVVIMGLGARMISGLKGDVAIPALNAKTAVQFVSENSAPSEGAPTFRQITMSPKTLAGYVDISRKLMMQSDPSVDQIIRDDITRQFAVKIDDVAIEGGASNEPTGILGTNGIGSVVMGTNGGAITFAKLVELEREVAVDNALTGRLSYLTNPKVVAAMRTTARQTSGVEGNFILGDGNNLMGYPVVSTTTVPSDLTKGNQTAKCSAVIFGNFSDLMIGMWGGLDILVDPYSGSAAGTTRIACFQDIDVKIRNAESFAAIKDVTTA